MNILSQGCLCTIPYFMLFFVPVFNSAVLQLVYLHLEEYFLFMPSVVRIFNFIFLVSYNSSLIAF